MQGQISGDESRRTNRRTATSKRVPTIEQIKAGNRTFIALFEEVADKLSDAAAVAVAALGDQSDVGSKLGSVLVLKTRIFQQVVDR